MKLDERLTKAEMEVVELMRLELIKMAKARKQE